MRLELEVPRRSVCADISTMTLTAGPTRQCHLIHIKLTASISAPWDALWAIENPVPTGTRLQTHSNSCSM